MNNRPYEVATHNRGVNITSDDFEQNEEDDTLQQDTASRLHTDIQNMIDVIETGTPHFLYTTSSVDGDNEESLISSTSIVSSVVKVKQIGINKDSSVTNNYCQSEISGHADAETYNVCSDCHYDPAQPLCIPAVLPPAVLCMNPHCVCTHSKGFIQHVPVYQNVEVEKQKNEKNLNKKNNLTTIFEKITGTCKEKNRDAAPLDLYKMNITQHKDDSNIPKRFVFDLIEGIPKSELQAKNTNTKVMYSRHKQEQVNSKLSSKNCNCSKETRNTQYTGMVLTHPHAPEELLRHKRALCREEKFKYKHIKDDPTRVDVYYFDHGNAAYYRTTDCPPIISTESMAEKTENYATKFWAELFGTIYIGFAFVTTFVLQLFRFICHSIIRPLTIGLLQLLSDYFLKPFLAVCFNSVVQPPLIFIYNIATSLRDLCDPVAEGVGYFLRESAVLCKRWKHITPQSFKSNSESIDTSFVDDCTYSYSDNDKNKSSSSSEEELQMEIACNDETSDILIQSEDNVPNKKHNLMGRRVVDIQYFLDALKSLKHEGTTVL
ncbi:hypothetical protein FQR65_LT14923 [Abscondita terminalis]|nr:hypothetical protein FQR65_LT14923 [Abscondita terminalis]